MTEEKTTKTVQIRIDPDLHRKIKAGAAKYGESMPKWGAYIMKLGVWQQEQDSEEEALKMQIQQRNECPK